MSSQQKSNKPLIKLGYMLRLKMKLWDYGATDVLEFLS